MEGGITEWITTVIETKFSGDRITARENALFETRRRAGEMFTELNSLPDSLKTQVSGVEEDSLQKSLTADANSKISKLNQTDEISETILACYFNISAGDYPGTDQDLQP